MRITLVQTTLAWEQPAPNRAHLTEKLAALGGQTDLIVLPEMFTSGFSMSVEKLAEPMNGPTVQWMQSQAATLGAALCGSFICRAEDGTCRNRLVFATPDGKLEYYDKRHRFALGGEDQYYTAGTQRLVVEYMGKRICPLICYDLRFPEWSRNSAENGYDLLLYVANWPARRAGHWKQLLQARAIENQSFVAGVNMVGKDGNGLEYSGDSSLIDYSGQILWQISDAEGLYTAELSFAEQNNYRQQLPFLRDSAGFLF